MSGSVPVDNLAASSAHASSSSSATPETPVSSSSHVVSSVVPPSEPFISAESLALTRFLAFRKIKRYDGSDGIRTWIRTFNNFCLKFRMDLPDRLAEVGFYLDGDAQEWHQDHSFCSWKDWCDAAIRCFELFELSPMQQLGMIHMSQFKSIREFLHRFQHLVSKALCLYLEGVSEDDLAQRKAAFYQILGTSLFERAVARPYAVLIREEKPDTL